MNSIPSTLSTTKPVQIDLIDQQRALRTSANRWKITVLALVALGAAVGISTALFAATPLFVCGGIIAVAASIATAILIYKKKLSPILTPDQLLEKIKILITKSFGIIIKNLQKFEKELPEGKPSSEEIKKVSIKSNELNDKNKLMINTGFKIIKRKSKDLMKLAAELGSERAISWLDKPYTEAMECLMKSEIEQLCSEIEKLQERQTKKFVNLAMKAENDKDRQAIKKIQEERYLIDL